MDSAVYFSILQILVVMLWRSYKQYGDEIKDCSCVGCKDYAKLEISSIEHTTMDTSLTGWLMWWLKTGNNIFINKEVKPNRNSEILTFCCCLMCFVLSLIPSVPFCLVL